MQTALNAVWGIAAPPRRRAPIPTIPAPATVGRTRPSPAARLNRVRARPTLPSPNPRTADAPRRVPPPRRHRPRGIWCAPVRSPLPRSATAAPCDARPHRRRHQRRGRVVRRPDPGPRPRRAPRRRPVAAQGLRVGRGGPARRDGHACWRRAIGPGRPGVFVDRLQAAGAQILGRSARARVHPARHHRVGRARRDPQPVEPRGVRRADPRAAPRPPWPPASCRSRMPATAPGRSGSQRPRAGSSASSPAGDGCGGRTAGGAASPRSSS